MTPSIASTTTTPQRSETMSFPTRLRSCAIYPATCLGVLLPAAPGAGSRMPVYESWAAGQAALTDASPSADPDGDGLSNFLEFALGTSPVEKTCSGDYQRLKLVEVGGRLRAELTFNRCVEAVEHGVRYEIEVSESLRSWRKVKPVPHLTEKREIPANGLNEQVTIRLDESIDAHEKLFFRLVIDAVAAQTLEAQLPSTFPLGSLDGEAGFVIRGARKNDILGVAVSNLGDVNGDGFDDVAAGARGAGDERNGNYSGEVYVIFGSADPAREIGVEALDGTNGLTIAGADHDDRLGSVSAAGDVNGDGVADILLGAHLADVPEKNTGSAYVIFGSPDGLPALIEVGTLDGTNGFALRGASSWDRAGVAVSNAGDLNGDGLDDIAVGADLADSDAARSGKAYVVFGSDLGFPAEIDLGALDGTNGITLSGPGLDDFAGRDLANAGDVNGDGVTDLIIGSGDRRHRSGTMIEQEVYVLFGKTNGFPARLALDELDGTNGFRFRFKFRANEYAGCAVAGDGDLNGDGISDIAIANEEGGIDPRAAGEIYVVFGTADGFPAVLHADSFDGNIGTIFRGIQSDDAAGTGVDLVGDVNGDGKDDLLIGAARANALSEDEDFNDSGESYLIFGREAFLAEHFIADLLSGPDAVSLLGSGDGDLSGKAVSRAGDVNGDGAPDFIIGAHRANRQRDGAGNDEDSNAGAAYVIFGRNAVPPPAEGGTE